MRTTKTSMLALEGRVGARLAQELELIVTARHVAQARSLLLRGQVAGRDVIMHQADCRNCSVAKQSVCVFLQVSTNFMGRGSKKYALYDMVLFGYPGG
jgi:hypothetical protein